MNGRAFHGSSRFSRVGSDQVRVTGPDPIRPDPTRSDPIRPADPTRPDPTRPDPTRFVRFETLLTPDLNLPVRFEHLLRRPESTHEVFRDGSPPYDSLWDLLEGVLFGQHRSLNLGPTFCFLLLIYIY